LKLKKQFKIQGKRGNGPEGTNSAKWTKDFRLLSNGFRSELLRDIARVPPRHLGGNTWGGGGAEKMIKKEVRG